MREVSEKQNEIYEFLKTYTDNKGYPPSVREICEAVGLKSTSSVPDSDKYDRYQGERVR